MNQNNPPQLNSLLGIEFPIIMAPMFLVSNVEMVVEATKSGITGAIPALNYRTEEALKAALTTLKEQCEGPFGINLIVNKSNVKLDYQLKACIDHQVDFIITSLGSPKKVIEAAKGNGVKVFCDVTDLDYAQKVESMGADAIIAVNKNAGGHAGPLGPEELVPLLKKHCTIPVISAGGVGDGAGVKQMLDLGADGLSMGSIFIGTEEAPVSEGYKQAIVEYGAQDIVMTTKLSGTPCTVINTPYVQKIGVDQSWFEQFLNKNRTLKKYVKMLTFFKGMKKLEKAAFSATYKTLWCAGPSIEHVEAIHPVAEVVSKLRAEYEQTEVTQA